VPGSHEVDGSIPFSSTNDDKGLAESATPFLVELSWCLWGDRRNELWGVWGDRRNEQLMVGGFGETLMIFL
jgi:hypothetical protein